MYTYTLTNGGGFTFGSDQVFMIEKYVGNALVENYQSSAPMQMLVMALFNEYTNAANSNSPIKIVVHGTKDVELPNGEFKAKPAKLVYYNDVYERNMGIDE